MFMSGWKYRPALIFSMIVGSMATIVDLIIIKRWNVAVGVPDKVFFLFGNAVFENLTNILHAIPMSALSAISPPEMESAVFGKWLHTLFVYGVTILVSTSHIFLLFSLFSGDRDVLLSLFQPLRFRHN